MFNPISAAKQYTSTWTIFGANNTPYTAVSSNPNPSTNIASTTSNTSSSPTTTPLLSTTPKKSKLKAKINLTANANRLNLHPSTNSSSKANKTALPVISNPSDSERNSPIVLCGLTSSSSNAAFLRSNRPSSNPNNLRSVITPQDSDDDDSTSGHSSHSSSVSSNHSMSVPTVVLTSNATKPPVNKTTKPPANITIPKVVTVISPSPTTPYQNLPILGAVIGTISALFYNQDFTSGVLLGAGIEEGLQALASYASDKKTESKVASFANHCIQAMDTIKLPKGLTLLKIAEISTIGYISTLANTKYIGTFLGTVSIIGICAHRLLITKKPTQNAPIVTINTSSASVNNSSITASVVNTSSTKPITTHQVKNAMSAIRTMKPATSNSATVTTPPLPTVKQTNKKPTSPSLTATNLSAMQTNLSSSSVPVINPIANNVVPTRKARAPHIHSSTCKHAYSLSNTPTTSTSKPVIPTATAVSTLLPPVVEGKPVENAPVKSEEKPLVNKAYDFCVASYETISSFCKSAYTIAANIVSRISDFFTNLLVGTEETEAS